MYTQANRASSQRDVYPEITAQLIAAIEADPGKSQLPWRKSSGALFRPLNALTQNAYNGINSSASGLRQKRRASLRPYGLRTGSSIGAQVRAGEKSSPVIFFKEFEAEPDPSNAHDDGKRRVALARI